MKNYSVTLNLTVSIGDMHYMSDFVDNCTSTSDIVQALKDVPKSELQSAYNKYIVEAFLRESILRGRQSED